MRRASLPPRPSLLPSSEVAPLRFGSARARLPSPRHARAVGELAWCLCAHGGARSALVAWRPRDASLVWHLRLPGDARFAVSPDGRLLLLVDDRGGRSLLDARTGVMLHEARDPGPLPDAIALARADARRALLVRGDRAEVIDLDTGSPVAHHRGRAPAALSPDGARVALTAPRAVTVFALRDGTSVRHPVSRGRRVTAIDLSQGLALGFDDGAVSLDGAIRGAPTRSPVTALRRGGDGALAVGHADGLLRAHLPEGTTREALGDGPVADITPALGAVFHEPAAAPVHDLRAHVRHDPRVGHRDAVSAVALAGDGNRLVTASRDGTLRVWDAATQETLVTLEGHAGPVASLALAPDGRSALSCGERDGLRAWCLATGDERPLPSPTASRVRARRLLVSPCGRRVAALTEGEALLLDATTGALVGRAPLGPWGAVAAFDARGEALFVPRAEGPEGVVVARLDAATGEALADVTLPAPPRATRRARGCSLVREVDGELVTAETDRAAVTRWTLGASPVGQRYGAGADLLRAPLVAAGERLLVAAAGGRVDVCDLADGARASLHLPERHDAVTSLTAARGRWFVVGTAQGLAQRFEP